MVVLLSSLYSWVVASGSGLMQSVQICICEHCNSNAHCFQSMRVEAAQSLLLDTSLVESEQMKKNAYIRFL